MVQFLFLFCFSPLTVVSARVVRALETRTGGVFTLDGATVTLTRPAVGEAVVAALALVTLPPVHVGHAQALAGLRLAETVPGADVVTVAGYKGVRREISF